MMMIMMIVMIAIMMMMMQASHPEIQEKCQEELRDIFGEDRDRAATSGDLANMRYLEMCLKESLRLYQSVPIITRTIGEDVVIADKLIPSGTNVIMAPCLLHRDPILSPEPDTFIPERFLPENCARRHPYSYLPFSAGPRNCIGQK